MKAICNCLNTTLFVLSANLRIVEAVTAARAAGSSLAVEFKKKFPSLNTLFYHLETIHPYIASGFISAVLYAQFAADQNADARYEFERAIMKFSDDRWILNETALINENTEDYVEKIKSILVFFITKCSTFKNQADGKNPDLTQQALGLLIGLELIRRANAE